MNLDELDNALDALTAVNAEVSRAMGDDDDFDPRSGLVGVVKGRVCTALCG